MAKTRFVRGTARSLALLVVPIVVVMCFPAWAVAQSEEEVYRLGLAAEETIRRGVTNHPSYIPVVLEIAQRYGVDGSFEISPWEAQQLLWEVAEDREEGRYVGLPGSKGLELAGLRMGRQGRVVFGSRSSGPGLLLVGRLTCEEKARKQNDANRVARALQAISLEYGAASALGRSLSWAGRFVSPLGTAAVIAGALAGVATWMANDIANASCWTGALPWQLRTPTLHAALDRDRWTVSMPGSRQPAFLLSFGCA
jgi:hypothetical protein